MDKFGYATQGKCYTLFRPTYSQPLLANILPRLGRKGTLLDIATGTGQILLRVAPYFQKAIGTDISPKMIEACRQSPEFKNNSKNVELRVTPWQKSLLPTDSKADLITIGQALHWLEPRKFMQFAHNSLTPGGLLFVLGYYPLGITYRTDNCQFNKKGLTHYEKLHQRLKPYFGFNRDDLRLQYQTTNYPFKEVFKEVQKGEQKVARKLTLEQFVNYIKTFTAYNVYVQKHGSEEVLQEFIASCNKDGIMMSTEVEQEVDYFYYICKP